MARKRAADWLDEVLECIAITARNRAMYSNKAARTKSRDLAGKQTARAKEIQRAYEIGFADGELIGGEKAARAVARKIRQAIKRL